MLKERLFVIAALNYTCLINSPSNSEYFFVSKAAYLVKVRI